MVATKERLEGVGGGEREGETEMITPAQRKREMEAVKKEVCVCYDRTNLYVCVCYRWRN